MKSAVLHESLLKMCSKPLSCHCQSECTAHKACNIMTNTIQDLVVCLSISFHRICLLGRLGNPATNYTQMQPLISMHISQWNSWCVVKVEHQTCLQRCSDQACLARQDLERTRLAHVLECVAITVSLHLSEAVLFSTWSLSLSPAQCNMACIVLTKAHARVTIIGMSAWQTSTGLSSCAEHNAA